MADQHLGTSGPAAVRVGRALSDAALMLAVREGSREAFDHLLARHYAPVANFGARMTGSDELGLEVAQQVFTALYDQRARYRSAGHLRGWLYAMARRQCQKVVRRERRRAGDAAEAAPAIADDPAAAAEQRATLADLRAAVMGLPERERAAVILFHYGQWSYDEIAAALGCSPGAARTAACRGRARLRAMLARLEEG